MIRFAFDECFHGKVLRALLVRKPDLNYVRIQDLDLPDKSDPFILEWASVENRIIVTPDKNTMIGYASRRITSGLRMPGMIVVGKNLGFRTVIDDLLTIDECSQQPEWEGQIKHLPI